MSIFEIVMFNIFGKYNNQRVKSSVLYCIDMQLFLQVHAVSFIITGG